METNNCVKDDLPLLKQIRYEDMFVQNLTTFLTTGTSFGIRVNTLKKITTCFSNKLNNMLCFF